MEDQKEIDRENENMELRMKKLQSFISTKELDKSFNEEHQKLIKKLRKVEDGKLILPTISYNNPISNRNNNTEPNSKKIKE